MSIVVIPARYASTRLEGKPLRYIGDVPMILRVAQQCMKSKADRVIAATDDQRILEVLEKQDGLESTMTPPDLPTGTDRVAKVAKYIHDDIVINVQGDEPFIDPSLIDALIDVMQADKTVSMATAKVKIENEEDIEDFNTVKVVCNDAGEALYFSRLPVPYNRDGIKGVNHYQHIGIYAYRRDFLLKFAEMEPSALEKAECLEQLRALEAGVKIKVVETDYRPMSVDTEEDLIKCEEFIKRKS